MSALLHEADEWSDIDTNDVELVLKHALGLYAPGIALASSFSQEDVLLLGLLAEIDPKVRVFSLDTGRLHEETYRYAEGLRERWGLRFEWLFPERRAVEAIEREGGLFSFRHSLEARHACCQARKVEPSSRVLGGLAAWITGQRRSQSVTRDALEVVERRPGQPVKLNPLAHWSFEDVAEALHRRGWPRHPLYAQGFRSIGCAPCTRATEPHEDERAGRWWWESAEHKECGLHPRSGLAAQENKR